MYHTLVQTVLFFVVIYCSHLWCNCRVYRQLRHLPGPLRLPLLGSGHVFLGKNCSQVFYIFRQLSAKYGHGGWPVRFYLGSIPFVIVHRPEHAQAILGSSACLEKPWIYRYTPLEGLFSLPVEKWRAHRKVIQPSFNLTVLKSFIPVFRTKVAIMLERLDHVVEAEAFDAYGYVAACTLDMVYATTLGMEMNIQRQEQCRYLDVLEELFELVTKRVTNVLLHPQWIYRMTNYYRKERVAREVFCAPAKEVLERRPILVKSCLPETASSSKPQIFIDQLYRIALTDPNFDRNAIEKELNTMIFAGNETTATTIANTLLLLAMHPTVQDKLVAEITLVVGNDPEKLSIDHLQQLPYMEAVLKEAMRLLPITTILGRTTVEDLQLDKVRVPAGVNLAIDVFSIHRSREHWGPDADSFVPERFLDGEQYHPYAFLGFSAGPRNCIGTRYAWISMKMMLVGVLRRFELVTPLKLEDIRIKAAMTLKVMNKHMIRLKRRL